MKYCPKCKTRAAGDDVVCTKCGGPLRSIGAPAAGETPVAEGSEEQLVLRLQGLQHEVGRSRNTMLILGSVAAALIVFFVILLISIYVQGVRQYATLQGVNVVSSNSLPGTSEISFTPSGSGKVEFIRETSGRTETLIEYADATRPAQERDAEQKFVWAGGKSGDCVIRVRYRDGWSVAEREWKIRPER